MSSCHKSVRLIVKYKTTIPLLKAESDFTNSFKCVTLDHNSFIHSGYFNSASSSPLLLRGAPDTTLCRSFTPKRHRQLRVKDLPKIPTWRLKRDSNPRQFEREVTIEAT